MEVRIRGKTYHHVRRVVQLHLQDLEYRSSEQGPGLGADHTTGSDQGPDQAQGQELGPITDQGQAVNMATRTSVDGTDAAPSSVRTPQDVQVIA